MDVGDRNVVRYCVLSMHIGLIDESFLCYGGLLFAYLGTNLFNKYVLGRADL